MGGNMNREAALNALADTVKLYNAHRRWLAWCDRAHAAKIASGLFEVTEFNTDLAIAVERVHEAVDKRPSMPSKDRKHQMYGHAYRAALLADLDVEPGSIQTMDGVADVIARVTAALAKA